MNSSEVQLLKRSNRIKKVSLLVMVIAGVLALTWSTCFAQVDFPKSEIQGGGTSPNLTAPSGKSWVFWDLPLGKYRFDTSVQLEPMDQKMISPPENDKSLEQKVFFLDFSIRW